MLAGYKVKRKEALDLLGANTQRLILEIGFPI